MINLALYCKQPFLTIGLGAVVGQLEDIHLSGAYTDIDTLREQTRISPPDVLLLEVTGEITLELVKELAVVAPGTGIVLWLDDSSPEFLAQAVGIGVRGILRKDQSIAVHTTCLRSVASGQIWIEREVATLLLSGQKVYLTKRERDLVGLLAQGLKNKAIATALDISEGTVKVYLSRLFAKVGANDRFELALIGLRNVEAGHSHALARVSGNPAGRVVPFLIPSFLSTERAPAKVA
jgi:DNA-binding NarL/FixJ family response regulator